MDQTADILRAFFTNRPEIQFAYLFGSVATGRINPMSDIDIAVHIDPASKSFKDDPFHFELNLKADLIATLRKDRLDLILLNNAPLTLAHQILRTGTLLFSRNEEARVAHFVGVSSLYPDVRRMLEVHYRNTLARIDSGTFGRDKRSPPPLPSPVAPSAPLRGRREVESFGSNAEGEGHTGRSADSPFPSPLEGEGEDGGYSADPNRHHG